MELLTILLYVQISLTIFTIVMAVAAATARHQIVQIAAEVRAEYGRVYGKSDLSQALQILSDEDQARV